MPDNFAATAGAGTNIAAHEVPFSGDTTKLQLVHNCFVTGAEGSKTVYEIHTDRTPAVTDYGQSFRAPVTSYHHRVATGTSGDAVNVKASAGTLKGLHVFNAGNVPCYVKFHNTAGTPTAGASVVTTFGCQAGVSKDTVLAGGGRAFSTGIGMTIVTGLADASSTGVTASEVIVEVAYE